MNFLDLQRDIATYVQMQGDTEVLGIAGSGLNQAVDEMNLKTWDFQVTSSGFAWSASSATYTAPTDMKTPRHIDYLDTSNKPKGQIGYLEPKEFFIYRDSVSDGEVNPHCYTVIDPYPSGKITLDSTPSSDFVTNYPSGTIYYYARIPTMTSNTDVLNVPPEVENVIRWKAKAQVALLFAQDKVQFAQDKADNLERKLIIRENEAKLKDWSR